MFIDLVGMICVLVYKGRYTLNAKNIEEFGRNVEKIVIYNFYIVGSRGT